MKLEKKDFVEVEFTAKTKDGEIFDSNIKEDLEKAHLNIEPKPFIFSLGQGMFLKGVEDFLIGKPSEKANYKIELPMEKAFGKRDPKLIKVMPMNVFREQKLNPVQGTMFNFDGRIAKIISVSGGRVTVDFNNPIAGKDVIYDIKVLRKIEDINEKAKVFIEFLFRKDIKFEIKDKKIVLDMEKNMAQLADLFRENFKEVLDLDLEINKDKETNSGKES